MKVASLCKTHSCNIFLEAAIESVYDSVGYIVFVNSNINWLGEYKKNECVDTILNWKNKHDKYNKIINLYTDVNNQYQQCNIGYKFIRDTIGVDWIHIFDTDEVWDKCEMQKLLKYAAQNPAVNSFGAHMHTYLKSVFYRVVPPEYCKPTVLIRPIFEDIYGTRGNKVMPRFVPDDLYFHHFTYVRDSDNEVFKKIYTTLEGDREDVPQCELVPFDVWIKKWNNILKSKDLHTTKHYEKSWHKVVEISKKFLPITLQDKPIVKLFEERKAGNA